MKKIKIKLASPPTPWEGNKRNYTLEGVVSIEDVGREFRFELPVTEGEEGLIPLFSEEFDLYSQSHLPRDEEEWDWLYKNVKVAREALTTVRASLLEHAREMIHGCVIEKAWVVEIYSTTHDEDEGVEGDDYDEE